MREETAEGSRDGDRVAIAVGARVLLALGEGFTGLEGEEDGMREGFCEGLLEGAKDGVSVEGKLEGSEEGPRLGKQVGNRDGLREGTALAGLKDGLREAGFADKAGTEEGPAVVAEVGPQVPKMPSLKGAWASRFTVVPKERAKMPWMSPLAPSQYRALFRSATVADGFFCSS